MRSRRREWLSLALGAILIFASFPVHMVAASAPQEWSAAAAPAQSPGRRGFFRFLVNVAATFNPVAGVIKSGIERRDAYREADSWYQNQIKEATARANELRDMYRQGQIDLHTYVTYRAYNQQVLKDAQEAQGAWKGVAHDRFNRDFMQVLLDKGMSRVLASEKFTRTVGEVNDAFSTTASIMERGLQGLDRLVESAVPGDLLEVRDRARTLHQQLANSPVYIDEVDRVRRLLERIDNGITAAENDIKNGVQSTEPIKQLREEVPQAVRQLRDIQGRLNDEVRRMRERGGIHISSRGLDARARDMANRLQRTENRARDFLGLAALEAVVRRALTDEIGALLEQRGISKDDPRYVRLMDQMMRVLAETALSERMTPQRLREMLAQGLAGMDAEDRKALEEALDLVIKQLAAPPTAAPTAKPTAAPTAVPKPTAPPAPTKSPTPTTGFACPPGFVFDRMSGVGCKQENCGPNGHWDYTGHCIPNEPKAVVCTVPGVPPGWPGDRCKPFCPPSFVYAYAPSAAACPPPPTRTAN